MPGLTSFVSVSLDGFFSDANGDSRWAHSGEPDPEFDAFVQGNASGNGRLLMGRTTYELMASYWPTPQANADNPVVAQGMNRMQKVVFSRSLDAVSWANSVVVKDAVAGVRKLKAEPGPNMAILGSGSIISQLAQEGLIDEIQLVVLPIILGQGQTLFPSVRNRPRLKLTQSRAFPKGQVLLCYAPVP